jgi:hypothetical protein
VAPVNWSKSPPSFLTAHASIAGLSRERPSKPSSQSECLSSIAIDAHPQFDIAREAGRCNHREDHRHDRSALSRDIDQSFLPEAEFGVLWSDREGVIQQGIVVAAAGNDVQQHLFLRQPRLLCDCLAGELIGRRYHCGGAQGDEGE